MAAKVELVYKAPLGYGESPHWIAEEKSLVFVDIPGRSVFRFDEKTGDVTKAVCEGAKNVSFIIPVKNNPGKYVVGADLKVCSLEWDGGNTDSLKLTELVSAEEEEGNRFSDGKCDRSGRLWLGTMGAEHGPGAVNKKHAGNLYTLTKDKKLEKRIPKVSLSNGLAWSPDNSVFYFVDTVEHRVDAYDFDISSCAVSNRRTVYDFAAHYLDSLPDGLTVDVDGKLWLATYLGQTVLHIDPETQKIIDTIEMPVPNVTSCCWGGEQLDTLYVTTSARCSDFEAYPLGGSLFKINGLRTKGLASEPVDLPV